MEGRIVKYEPPSLLEYTWRERGNDSLVRMELIPDGENTVLVVTHSGLSMEAHGFAAGWHSHLDWLDHVLAGTAATYDEKARFMELMAQYSASA
jgi:uncharacterized protein YndB with AHSA1/START domain